MYRVVSDIEVLLRSVVMMVMVAGRAVSVTMGTVSMVIIISRGRGRVWPVWNVRREGSGLLGWC